jgi:hypothetical protein
MIRHLRHRRAERWDAEARHHREAADLIKRSHDRLVNNGGKVSLASFDLYATLIGKAEDCERRAARWRP